MPLNIEKCEYCGNSMQLTQVEMKLPIETVDTQSIVVCSGCGDEV